MKKKSTKKVDNKAKIVQEKILEELNNVVLKQRYDAEHKSFMAVKTFEDGNQCAFVEAREALAKAEMAETIYSIVQKQLPLLFQEIS